MKATYEGPGLVLREAPAQTCVHFLTKNSCPEGLAFRTAPEPSWMVPSSGGFCPHPQDSSSENDHKDNDRGKRGKRPFPLPQPHSTLPVFPSTPCPLHEQCASSGLGLNPGSSTDLSHPESHLCHPQKGAVILTSKEGSENGMKEPG